MAGPPVVIEPLLDAPAVGQILGRHERTVRRMAEVGELKSVRLGRRNVRFRPEDVRAYIESHLVGGGSS